MGFDPSAEVIRQAGAAAQQLKPGVNALVAREETSIFGQGEVDPDRDEVRSACERRRCSSLSAGAQAAGGIFLYENNNAGVPNELLRAFLGFRILRF